MAVDITIGMARRVGFLEIFQRVWNYITSAFVVGVWPQPAGQCRRLLSGLPSEMRFEGHTCFY